MLVSHVGVDIEDELVVKPNSTTSQQAMKAPLAELVQTSFVLYPGEATPSPQLLFTIVGAVAPEAHAVAGHTVTVTSSTFVSSQTSSSKLF